jgi:hypothetical protein
MASTYTFNGPWHGQTDGWRWTMRRLEYTPMDRFGSGPHIRSEVYGEVEQGFSPGDFRPEVGFPQPFTVDFVVPLSGGVVARCMVEVGYFGYGADLRFVGGRAEGEMIGIPEYRLPQHPLWNPDLDGLAAECDRDSGVRMMLAERMQDLDLWDEASAVQKAEVPAGRYLSLVRRTALDQHCRRMSIFLPCMEYAAEDRACAVITHWVVT